MVSSMKATTRPIALFLLTAFGLAWLVVVFAAERPANKAHALGLRPLGLRRRFVGFLALGLLVPIALGLIALVVGSLLGVYRADLVEFSEFPEALRAQLAATGVESLPAPIGVIVAVQFVAVLFGGF